jgi:hypothetical protein
LSIFASTSEHQDYKCLFSNNKVYNQKTLYTVYDIPPLLRLLLTKNEVLSEKDLLGLYENTHHQVCFIQEWNDHVKKVIIFNLDELTYFDEEKFNEILENQSQRINKVFQKAFHFESESRNK